MTGTIAPEWDERVLAAHSVPHFMQSRAWASIRSGGPWQPAPLDLGAADRPMPVLAFTRTVAGVGALRHLPRISGLAPEDVPGLTAAVAASADGAFATKVEVYQPRDRALEQAFLDQGWRPTRASQYRYAVVVDLADGPEGALARMKKRARAEIRVGERNGVVVDRADVDGSDAEEMLGLVRATEERSGAFFRSDDYLRRVWAGFAAHGQGALYLARHDGRVVSGAFVVTFGRSAWYKDGGSLRDAPQLMASRLLHWRVMQDLAAAGIDRYDLGHVPPPDTGHPAGRGLLIFKGAFAPDVTEYLPAFLLPHTPAAEAWRAGEAAFIADHRERTGDYWY
ncbi:GNAT family N-acetyltransferase [Agromyces sp. G08B096]|uniref:GNAT family N-acetyltransferase n=1 Tax=Agromyces sp. G08B096 TaxID=3156399 RepID=A0AAU7WB13_9MICO